MSIGFQREIGLVREVDSDSGETFSQKIEKGD